ncbi:type IV pilus assembly protein FimV [Halopseudomonas salina]|uniref:Peptidoglycan-binding protein n=1 Tax=Halopseudomonas salina TaxID=1323744 RepID=A0ABQ1Q005_9GAMM|nr:FimV/HubP family polar landmark protein [Halopseudomonas salina]GGD08485.1 peptidoglycan-binding protein [Halopseudomonas salina]
MAVKRQVIVGVASLAALYVGVSNALGLGEMRLDSSLNQPLSATIQLQDAQGLSASDIIVSLAAPDAFDRAGIDRPFFLTDLRFVPVVENNRLLIRVESTRPVREPYLNFLVELRRPGGRMLREYTVLLDPPLYDPQAASIAAPVAPRTQPPVVSAPAPASAPVARQADQAVAQPASQPASTALQSLPDLQPQSGARQYTTVAGDSLWDIAVNQRPDSSVPIRVSMSAIHALNPEAFIGGDIDKLRQGHTLIMPTTEQLVTAGAPQELLAGRDATQESVAEAPAAPSAVEEPVAPVARPEEDASELAEVLPAEEAEPATDPVADASEVAPSAETQSDAAVIADTLPAEDSDSAEVRLRIEETTLEAVDADSAALLGRLNALESRFNVLLSELDARDAQIASLQAELEVLRAAKAAEAEMDGDLAGTAGAGSIGSGDAGSGPSAAGGSDDPTAGAVAANVLPGEEPEATASSTSWLSWLTLPLVFIAFLLGWLLSRRRHQEEEPAEVARPVVNEPHGGFSSNITTVPAMVARPVAQPAAKPVVDPLDGVELYVTYGRFAEARTMLDKAIDEEPERLDLRYKQLRVLAELGDGAAFAEQEEEVTELGGEVERIDQIKARFPLMFNDRGDVVEQVDSLEPLLGEDEEENAAFRTGIDEEHDESNTSQLNLNDFTLDPDWDLIDGLSPEPMRKSSNREAVNDTDRTISEEEFESSLHKFPQVEELDADQDKHFSSTDAEHDKPADKK